MRDIDLKLVIALARAHSSVFREIEKSMHAEGLNPSEFGVLELLYHKGKQPVQQVAQKILVTSGTMTYVIDKLVKKGLVERKQCEKDKRIYYVELTQVGEAVIKELFPRHKQFLNALFEGIDEGVKTELIQQLFLLKDSIEQGGMTDES